MGLILLARGVSSVFVYSSSQVNVGRFDIPFVGLRDALEGYFGVMSLKQF